MTKAIQVSASQITAFNACPRAWAFDKIDKHPRKESTSFARGTRIHKVLELYLKTGYVAQEPTEFEDDGTDDPEGILDIYSLGIRLLKHAIENGNLPDASRNPVTTEDRIFVRVSDNANLLGFLDGHWQDPSGFYEILDHKTTSSFDYNKSPEQLLCNTQMGVYAYALREQGIKTPIRVTHIYYLTKNKYKVNTTRVTALMTDAHIDAIWADVVSATEKIVSLYQQGLTANQIDATGVETGHCNAYGGCSYKPVCDAHPKIVTINSLLRRTKENGGTTIMSNPIAERLRAKAAAAKASPTPEPLDATEDGPLAEGVLPPDAGPREYVEPQLTPIVDTEAPKKRGRPKGAKTVTGSTIYLGCMPMKLHEVTLFVDWIRPHLQRANEINGVPDYSLVEFGKGAGVVVGVVADAIAVDGIPSHMMVDPTDRIWGLVRHVVLEHAMQVISCC